MNQPLFDNPFFKMLDALNDAIIATACLYAEREKQDAARFSEHQRRQHALNAIDEVLEGRPLSAFSASQLELLELLVAYWRECEIEAGAPGPDPLPQ